MNKQELIDSIVEINSFYNDYEDAEPGFERDICFKIGLNGKETIVCYQASEPVYLSGAWLDREEDGETTGPREIYNPELNFEELGLDSETTDFNEFVEAIDELFSERANS